MAVSIDIGLLCYLSCFFVKYYITLFYIAIFNKKKEHLLQSTLFPLDYIHL